LGGVRDVRFVHFTERDVVRHPLVRKIVAAYDRYEHPQGGSGGERSRAADPVRQ